MPFDPRGCNTLVNDVASDVCVALGGGYAVGWGQDATWYDAAKGGTVPRKSVLKGFKVVMAVGDALPGVELPATREAALGAVAAERAAPVPPALAAATGRGLWQIKAAAAAAGAAGPVESVAEAAGAGAGMAGAEAAGAGTGPAAAAAVGEYGSTDWRECGEWGALDVQRLGRQILPATSSSPDTHLNPRLSS